MSRIEGILSQISKIIFENNIKILSFEMILSSLTHISLAMKEHTLCTYCKITTIDEVDNFRISCGL